MPVKNPLTRVLLTGLGGLMLFGGCAATQDRKVRLPRLQWNHMAYPTLRPSRSGPAIPVPADPSGSPYGTGGERGLYVPQESVPEAGPGVAVPPPGPPEGEEPPHPLPPAPEDMDVTFPHPGAARRGVIPPPAPAASLEDSAAMAVPAPEVAGSSAAFRSTRQYVVLHAPEPDLTAELPFETEPFERPGMGATEVYRQSQLDRLRPDLPFPAKSGHTPPLSDSLPALDFEPLDEGPQEQGPLDHGPLDHGPLDQGRGYGPLDNNEVQELPEMLVPTGPAGTGELEPLPILDDGDVLETPEISVPGVNQTSGTAASARKARVIPAAAIDKMEVQSFLLISDSHSASGGTVLSAGELKRGQRVVVRSEIAGLKAQRRQNQSVTKVSYRLELRDKRQRSVFKTPLEASVELTADGVVTRPLMCRFAVPRSVKAGSYVLQLHLLDEFRRQSGVAEMPVEIH